MSGGFDAAAHPAPLHERTFVTEPAGMAKDSLTIVA
jgi:hypothetical protein